MSFIAYLSSEFPSQMAGEKPQADSITRRQHRSSVPDITMEPSAQLQRIILFGDQTESVLPAIQTLYKRAPSSIYIQHFLRVSTDAARQSLEDLCNGSEKTKFYFDSFLTLAQDSAQRQCPDVVVQTLLLCVAQLGHLILYVHGASDNMIQELTSWKQETRRRTRMPPELHLRGMVYRASTSCSCSLFTIAGPSPPAFSRNYQPCSQTRNRGLQACRNNRDK